MTNTPKQPGQKAPVKTILVNNTPRQPAGPKTMATANQKGK